jgi:hypothetical protein
VLAFSTDVGAEVDCIFFRADVTYSVVTLLPSSLNAKPRSIF